jgi:hypothetical protein
MITAKGVPINLVTSVAGITNFIHGDLSIDGKEFRDV